jgi:small subunit ribosomal protein S6
LRYYEFVYIVSPEVEEEDLEKVTARVGQMIADGGGEVLRLESWGRRRLAYPIRRFREGHYLVAYVQMEPAAIAGLRGRLALAEEVIRYLLVKTDAAPAQTGPRVSPPQPVDLDQEEEEDTEPEADQDRDTEDTDEE